MPRRRSLLTRIEVDEVKKAHNCQGNQRHRLERGNRRLKVRNARGWDHYCVNCAQRIVDQDIAALQDLARKLQE